jgi:hypothetical protein
MGKQRIRKSERHSRRTLSRKRRRQIKDQQLNEIINRAKSKMSHLCELCGRYTEDIGIFIPSKPSLWGAPTGKDRLIFYPLCERCRTSPDALVRVEARIAEHYSPRVEAAT